MRDGLELQAEIADAALKVGRIGSETLCHYGHQSSKTGSRRLFHQPRLRNAAACDVP
jgi:hypothetical protein